MKNNDGVKKITFSFFTRCVSTGKLGNEIRKLFKGSVVEFFTHNHLKVNVNT